MMLEGRRRQQREVSGAGAPDVEEGDENEEPDEVTPPKASGHADMRKRLSGFMKIAQTNMAEKATERKRKNDLMEERNKIDKEEAKDRREQTRLLMQLVANR
jgi:hypothetical protein